MNRSRALIKLATVALAAAGAIVAAMAQQAPAQPNWNAPAGALPGPATTAPSSNAAPAASANAARNGTAAAAAPSTPAGRAPTQAAGKMERPGQAEAMKEVRKRDAGQPAAPAAREGAR